MWTMKVRQVGKTVRKKACLTSYHRFYGLHVDKFIVLMQQFAI